MLDSQIWNTPCLPDNPATDVAPFLPEQPGVFLPRTGRMISEIILRRNRG